MANKAINDLLKYNIVWLPWTQPVLTSNTSYGTVSANAYYSSSYPWRAADGTIPVYAQENLCWKIHNSEGQYPGWWKWEFPFTLFISQLKFYGSVDYDGNTDFNGRWYTDSTKSVPIGDAFSIGHNSQAPLITPANQSAQGYITNSIYLDATSGNNGGIGELVITAKYFPGGKLIL